MEPKNTSRPSKKTVLARSTDAPSAASKNTSSKRSCDRKAEQRGLGCEQAVAEHLAARGLEIVARRVEIGGVEVDILARESGGDWVLVEVKSLSHWDWLPRRLTKRQQQRLERAVQVWMIRTRQPVSLWLAVVDRAGGITVFSEF